MRAEDASFCSEFAARHIREQFPGDSLTVALGPGVSMGPLETGLRT